MPSTLPFPNQNTICARLATGDLTDATPTQLLDILGLPIISVTNPAYGAVGDGVTDDTAAILAAYAAATALGGAIVYFPPGSYVLNAFTVVPANTTIMGSGMGATTIIHADGLTGTGHLFEAGGANVTVADLTIDGNQANNVGFTFSEITAAGQENTSIKGVEIIDWRFIGISGVGVNTLVDSCRIVGNGATSIVAGAADNTVYSIWAAWPTTQLKVVNSFIKDSSFGGIFCGGITQIINNYIEGTHWSISPGGGGQIADGAEGTVIATGNYVGPGGNHLTSGFELNRSSIIEGNLIDGQGHIGIILQNVESAGHHLSGNTIKNGGSGGSGGDRVGIRVNAGVTDFSITDNIITDDQGTPTQQYGIRVMTGASDRYNITNNRLTNNVVSQLTDGGTGTTKTVAGNEGYNPIASTAITVTASPFSWTNNTGSPVTAFALGGTVSAITLDGSTIAAATPKDVAVPHGGTLVVTYSSAPTMKYIGF